MEFKSKKQELAGFIGSFLTHLFPEKTNKLRNGSFTIDSCRKDNGIVEKLLKLGLLHTTIKSENMDLLADYHLKFWQSDGAVTWHQHADSKPPILPQFECIIDDINSLNDNSSVPYDTLCEIGSGTGKLLNHLSKNLTNIKTFTGLDLSEETVAKANKEYGKQNIQFFAADAKQWIKENGRSHCIYLCYGGVLEYFPQDILLAFLTSIKEQYSPCIFAIVEPNGINHDLSATTESESYSNEFSYSHHYEYLFGEAGFNIKHAEIKHYEDHFNMMYLLATG